VAWAAVSRAPHRVSDDDEEGIIVTARIGDDVAQPAGDRKAAAMAEPTRYALHLRRQAVNRMRSAKGRALLPVIRPGDCPQCAGWGVETVVKVRCDRCGGSGMQA
jgi:hypothetical protein